MQATSRNWTKRRIVTALLYSVPAFAMLVATGCQDQGPCGVAGVCDDSDACTTDTCTVVDGAAVCANTAVDCAGQVCNPADGECVDCFDDAGCADADFCNGDETCVDSACVAGTDPCADGESCDDDTDECVASCSDDASCDDGLFCTGTETCDSNGLCASSGDPCDAGANETCNDDTDTCDLPAVDCNSNGDCEANEECLNNVCVAIVVPDCNSNGDCPDDGLFCNGTESCNTNSLSCESSGDPCLPEETCNEDTDACDNNNPATSTVLTNLIDLLMTGPGDDTITGTRDGTADGDTISIGDDIDGEGGMDRANFIATSNTVPAIDMSNVEEVYVRSLTAAITIDCSNYDGVNAVAYNNGTSALTLNNFGALLDVHIIGGNGGADDFNVTFDDDLLDTAAGETMNVTLNGSDIDDLNLNDFATNNEGPEIINVMGMGGDNVLDDIFSGDGSDDEGATVNITGASNVRINGLNNATTVTGTAATGDLDLTLDPGEDVTVKTGTGNDTIRTAGGLDNDDDIDTGTGTDRVATTSAVTIEDLTAVGVEEWEIGGAVTVDFDNETPSLIVMTGNNNTVADNVAK
ncbi:MAG: hypothetical protein GXP29_14090, partial [Planctomycetes bacterium]|nr:hypothetical protein [Planctomycetota bacterium]